MAIMPIEAGARVREYATATAGRPPGLPGRPEGGRSPPTFLATVVFWTPIGATLRSPEGPAARAPRRAWRPTWAALLSLEQEYVYHGPPPARRGETLETAERLSDITVKRTRDGAADGS